MKFWVWENKSGKVVGWLASEARPSSSAVEVTEKEFVKYGGSVPPPAPPSDPTPLELLQQENKLLKAQIQAQSTQLDLLEDCIVEMAMQVYE